MYVALGHAPSEDQQGQLPGARVVLRAENSVRVRTAAHHDRRAMRAEVVEEEPPAALEVRRGGDVLLLAFHAEEVVGGGRGPTPLPRSCCATTHVLHHGAFLDNYLPFSPKKKSIKEKAKKTAKNEKLSKNANSRFEIHLIDILINFGTFRF